MNAIKGFQEVNNTFTKNERYPIFSNPKDTLKSANEYVEVLKKRTKEELEQKFGSSFEEYKPKILKKSENEIDLL